MKVEGSHRSSLMLLWNSFAADFAFHFFLGSIYQYREEKKNGRIGKEVICSSKETGTQRAVTSCARSSLSLRCVLGLRHILASRVRCAKTSGTRKSLDATPNLRSPANTSMYLRERGKQENRKTKRIRKVGRKDRDKTLLFGKDSAFFVSLDLPGVSLSILRNLPEFFRVQSSDAARIGL